VSVALLKAEGRVLFLSGATGGIGRAIQDQYLAAGGRVASFDLTPSPAREDVFSITGNAADESDAKRAAAEALAHFGRIDGFVHAAGIVGPGAVAEISTQGWRDVVDANLTSAFLLAQALEPQLKQNSGAAVFFGSVNGSHGGSAVSGPAYAVAKAGLANFGRYLSKEWAPLVRVNTIIAGPVRTPMLDRLSPETLQAAKNAMLTRELIEPAEAAATAAFLLSEHARSITGASINLSGGLVLD
jgi:Dehydrogenases with different specificities (related to short-chain alcohol dehydrogenases)